MVHCLKIGRDLGRWKLLQVYNLLSPDKARHKAGLLLRILPGLEPQWLCTARQQVGPFYASLPAVQSYRHTDLRLCSLYGAILDAVLACAVLAVVTCPSSKLL